MRRLITFAAIICTAALGWPARADVLIGVAGPMTGTIAWFGEQMERGVGLAVADLNVAGGMLGEQVRAHYCGRLLRSRAGGRRRKQAGQ